MAELTTHLELQGQRGSAVTCQVLWWEPSAGWGRWEKADMGGRDLGDTPQNKGPAELGNKAPNLPGKGQEVNRVICCQSPNLGP